MYKLVLTGSMFLRIFIFPNPFTEIFELYFADTALSTSSSALADVFNLVFGGAILLPICYPLVGIVYDKGEAPAIGSTLYGLAVLFNSWLLSWISIKLQDIKLIIISFIAGIIIETIILLGIGTLKNNLLY